MYALLLFLLMSSVSEHANDPRVWNASGVLVAEHTSGQYAFDIAVDRDATWVAWDDASGDDSDIAVQQVADNGAIQLGANGYRRARAETQANPCWIRDGLVFRRNCGFDAQSVMLFEWSSGTSRAIELACVQGSIAELSAVRSGNGVIATWVRSEGEQRVIETALWDGHDVHTMIICSHTGNVMNVHMQAQSGFVMWAWTDWRDAQRPQVYGQALEDDALDLAWPMNGLCLSPDAAFSLQFALCGNAESGYVTLVYENDVAGWKALQFQIIDYLGNRRFSPSITVFGPSLSLGESTAAQFGDHTFIAWEADRALATRILDFDGRGVAQTWNAMVPTQQIQDLTSRASRTNAWLSWRDDRYGRGNEQVWLQKFDPDNHAQWRSSGAPVAETTGMQLKPSIALFSERSVIVGWQDYRLDPETPQVYLQRFE